MANNYWNSVYNTSLEDNSINSDTLNSDTTTTQTDIRKDNDNGQVVEGSSFESIVNDAAKSVDKAQEIKEDITQEELKLESDILLTPLNWTDPIVWHDPTISFGVIVMPQETDLDTNTAADAAQTSHKINGVYFPLIKINQKIIGSNEIVYMKLRSTELLPELTLYITDSNSTITNTNSAGVDNEIVVVITAPINGVYKKIKLSFYINSVTNTTYNNQRCLQYSCSIKVPALHQKQTKAMNYPNKKQWPGCNICKQPEQAMPNSWEMLHFIAKKCGLGFASTKKCKDVEDRKYRLFNAHDSFINILNTEKITAGTGEEDAIFDWWIDFYGYIVMVNVPWVLKEDIDNKHLGIYGIVGPQPTSESQKSPEPEPILVNRTLTTSKNTSTFAATHNLLINNYEVVTDNSLYELGTCATFNIFKPKGANGTNGCFKFDIQTEEQSVAGFATERYLTQKTFMRSVDMSGLDLQLKKELFSRYFQNKRAKKLIVELENFNLGLQRGSLVNVILTETDPKNKSLMVNNLKNINSQNTESIDDQLQIDPSAPVNAETNEQSPSNSQFVSEQNIEIVNQGLSGLYYIDGVEFEYNIEREQKIYQKLTLIKKGVWGNYITSEGYAQINHNELDSNPNITN